MEIERLYHFSNAEFDLLEIKRLGMHTGAPLSDVFKWLLINRKSQSVQSLNFVSMTTGSSEKRVFTEGHLAFDAQSALLTLKGPVLKLQADGGPWPRETIVRYLLNIAVSE